ncbi:MAG: DUF5340 domain-containing protein [Okeania sp. SIO2D1]|nr:DUF5340 domain-containing protein [Okeania sp. SIO2D1]
MEPIPLPSHVHYELLLQLLEQQTSFAANQNPVLRKQVQQLIVILRKAVAQQKQIENTCRQIDLPVEPRWSLNSAITKKGDSVEMISLPRPRNNNVG